MANKFLTNLRANRGNTQSSNSNSLPTRGDIQKQNRTEVSPNAFINFMRMLAGPIISTGTKDQESQSVEEAPAQNIDKMSPESEQTFIDNWRQQRESARNGSLNQENDLNKYNASINGTVHVAPGHSSFEKAYGILDNYDALNKVLDEYDKVNTWPGKRRYLEDAYKNFDSNDSDVRKWFNRLYDYTIEAQQFGEWDTKNVSNVMRTINDNVKERLLKQS